jgi:uncharacterized cofD-like protein
MELAMLRTRVDEPVTKAATPVPLLGTRRRTRPRVVALGGGTGLPILLRGLKTALFPPGTRWMPERDRELITGIVTVADDGGSSGRLRRAYGVLPPGDIRSCLLALSGGDPALEAMFSYRFNGNGDSGAGGHSLGNLMLAALQLMEGDFQRAVEHAGRILRLRGRVVPSTLERVTLSARFADGSRVEGESRIAAARRPIRRVDLEPREARPLPEALEAIRAADLVTIGPGSLYTSLIPVLLVRGVADAIARAQARVVLLMNLMTEPGETDGCTAADIVIALRRHAPAVPVSDVLLNSAPIPADALRRYAAAGSELLVADPASIKALGCKPVERDLLGPGPAVRHDPLRLARAVLELAGESLKGIGGRSRRG